MHGSAATDPSSKFPLYGGIAAGFVVTFESGYTVYFMGSSAATQDMALWGELYKPDAMIFLMSGFAEPLDVRAVLDSMGIRIPITDPVRKQVYELSR